MLSLRSLAEDRSLELNVLVEGAGEALGAEALWVHNTELPDPSPYIRERELVLTNGLWLGTTSATEFVANVARAGAVGIVFGLREATPVTPAELVHACRNAGLPLAELSADVPFTAVSQAAAAAVAEQRQQALVSMVRRGNALADAISQGAGASGVLRVLRRDHDLPLAVADRMGRLLATAGGELREEELRIVAEGLARHPPPLELAVGEAGTATLFLVGALGEADAGLVCLRPAHSLSKAEHDALTQAAHFLSLEVARRQAVQAIEMRFATELLDMILSGPSRAAEVPGRLEAFGIDASGPLAVSALAFSGEVATLPGLAEAVVEFFTAEATPVVVAGGSQDVIAVHPWRRPEHELPAMAERLAATLSRRFDDRRVVVGLGGVAAGWAMLRSPLMESREACRVLRRATGRSVALFAQLGTHRLLLGMQDEETLRRLASGVLGPLRAHDREQGGQLEATLRAFLDHDGHWATTAQALYVHVNTLRNRLARVTELTGRDVGTTEGRVDLFLALQADPGT
ncbi:helix-turn-helix domain-containing protein [Streptosporangium sp. NPDC051023]|uniref:helix-turn-helix domain-containing protein n=1 Tax=Streptosporangium sp. NPDC051023 TaxID=3155410 RepID=UPI00344E5216